MLKTDFLLDYGLPSQNDFDENHDDSPSFGSHEVTGWRVAQNINRTRPECLFGTRVVQVFERRASSYDALFRASVARYPTEKAVICGSRLVSYQELDAQVNLVASGFINVGLKSGDRVGVMLDNCLEYVTTTLACIRAGGIVVPIGTRLGPSEVKHIMEDSCPTLIVTNTHLQHLFQSSTQGAQIFLTDVPTANSNSFCQLLHTQPADMPELHEQDPMMIVYTSGTTGKPKGACLTHINFVHTCLHYLYALALDRPQRSLLAIPATHIAGFGPLLSVTLASGGSVYLMRKFTAREVLETIEKEKITYAVLVPTMYKLCSMDSSFHRFDLSSWIYGVYGGAIMPPSTIDHYAQHLPSLRLVNAYGATETCAVCTIMPPERTKSASTSVGLALECDEVLIVDDDFKPVPQGMPGEIAVRGPNVFPYYWNNPGATASSFREGYWLSGDIGSQDSDGLVYVHDRKKDMINRGGFKVFSAEVENALISNEDVIDCAVVGVPDEILGEKVFVYVQIAHHGLEADTLKSYLYERVADYKVPDYWLLTCDPVPRNQNGKLQKAQVKQIALSERPQIVTDS